VKRISHPLLGKRFEGVMPVSESEIISINPRSAIKYRKLEKKADLGQGRNVFGNGYDLLVVQDGNVIYRAIE